jgi:hypothetical protein
MKNPPIILGKGITQRDLPINYVGQTIGQVPSGENGFISGVFLLFCAEHQISENVLVAFGFVLGQLTEQHYTLEQVLAIVYEDFVF